MRDVRNFSTKEVVTYYRNGVLTNTNLGPRTVMRSQRSDAKSTVPLPDGSYAYPTQYEAFFGYASPGSGGFAEFYRRSGTTSQTLERVEWTGGYDNGDVLHGTVSLRPDVDNSCTSRARNNAIEKIRNSDLNLGQTIAEMREAVRTLTSIIMDVVVLAKTFRKGHNFSLRHSNSKEVADQWLRFQYGVKPMMNDAYAVLQVMENGLQGPVARVRSVAFDDTYKPPPGTPRRTYSGSFIRGTEVSYTLVLKNPELFQLWKYGLTDPLTIAWEVITFSFVIDWFLHIGSFLSGLQQPLGLSIRAGYQTNFLRNDFIRKEQWHENTTPVQGQSTSFRVKTPGWSTCSVHSKSMYRQVLPWVAPPLPYLDMELNVDQLLNAMALLGSFRG